MKEPTFALNKPEVVSGCSAAESASCDRDRLGRGGLSPWAPCLADGSLGCLHLGLRPVCFQGLFLSQGCLKTPQAWGLPSLHSLEVGGQIRPLSVAPGRLLLPHPPSRAVHGPWYWSRLHTALAVSLLLLQEGGPLPEPESGRLSNLW